MRRLLLLPVLLVPAVSFGWGFNGHRRLASMLQDPLPNNHCLRSWFSSRQNATLQDHACDPDRWRNTDPNEWPRHFLEIDRINPTVAYPRDWQQAMQTFPQYHTQNGRVPWRVEELYPQLVAAFAANNTTQILDLTFVLSHYVTDAFSVLHNTKDFNPGGTLHQRWESDMLAVSSQLNAVADASRMYFGTPGRADPKNNVFDIVMVGETLEPQLTQWHFANPTDEPAFFNAAKDLTARRWGDAVTLYASIVWTAWAEAGAPTLAGFNTTPGCSRAVPTAEIVLRGYPVPGGFTHPDGGTPPIFDAGIVDVPDGGPVDAGCIDLCGEDDGGTGGNGGGAGGGGGGDEEPPPCGCSAAPGLFVLSLALLLRRRRTS